MNEENCDQKGKTNGGSETPENQGERRSKEYPNILRAKFPAKKKRRKTRTLSESLDSKERVLGEEVTAANPSAERIDEDDRNNVNGEEDKEKKEQKVEEKKDDIIVHTPPKRPKMEQMREEEEDEFRGEDTQSLDEPQVKPLSKEKLSKEKVEEEEKPKDIKKPSRERLSREQVLPENEEHLSPENKKKKEKASPDDKHQTIPEKPLFQKKRLNLSKEKMVESVEKKDSSGEEKKKEDISKTKRRIKKTLSKRMAGSKKGKRSRKSRNSIKGTASNKDLKPNPKKTGAFNKFRKKLQPTTPEKQKLKKRSGLRDLFRFWRHKSDCIAQPTKEMLVKSVVAAEYDANDPRDFLPDPRFLFPDEEDWKLRMKNARSQREEVFINYRPFWLHKTAEDVLPPNNKMLGTSRYLNHSMTLPPRDSTPPRRQKFYDPKADVVSLMRSFDQDIVDDREKEMARIRYNTVHGVVAVHLHRKSSEKKKKTYTSSITEEKRTLTNSEPRVTFALGDRPDQLHVYNRKERPEFGKSRKFTRVEYVEGRKGASRNLPEVRFKELKAKVAQKLTTNQTTSTTAQPG